MPCILNETVGRLTGDTLAMHEKQERQLGVSFLFLGLVVPETDFVMVHYLCYVQQTGRRRWNRRRRAEALCWSKRSLTATQVNCHFLSSKACRGKEHWCC